MIYIPKDLDDCFEELKNILENEIIEEIKSCSEKDLSQYHHSLGRKLRNMWGFWNKSRLCICFNNLGIKHPDDMSEIIIKSFWRHINSQPIELEEQIKYYQNFWEKFGEESLGD